MRAKVIIYDDENNDCPKGAYELAPYDVQDNGISTKYLFEFEYNKVNYSDFYKSELPASTTTAQATIKL